MYTASVRWCVPVFLAAFASLVPAQTQPGQAAPQRTILDNRVTHGPSGEQGKEQRPPSDGAPGRTVESLLNSTEDLNSIRDGYLRRLAGDGCPPDVAIRVADLRARLSEGGSPSGGARRAARDNDAAQDESSAELEGSLLLLAAQWNQARPEATPAKASAGRDSERARLLDMVLSPADPRAAATQPGADAASMKTELDRLLAGCHAAAR